MSQNAVSAGGAYLAAVFVLLMLQCLGYFVAVIFHRFDVDNDLRDETFSVNGSQEHNSNFWSILVVGATAVASGALISLLQEGKEGSILDKVFIMLIGVTAYTVIAAVALTVGGRVRARKLPVSEIYWSLQKGEIVVESLGDEYRKMILKSLDSKKNTRHGRMASRSAHLVGRHCDELLSTILIYIAPFVLHVIFGVWATLAVSSGGQGDLTLIVLIWVLSTTFMFVSYFISFKTVDRLRRYHSRRAEIVNEFREYCKGRLAIFQSQ